MLAAISLLDDVINEVTIIGLNLDDRDKGRKGDLMVNNIKIQSRFLDFDYKMISNFVNTKLIEISKKYECKILYCAERSSHVWGSSHSKSDNDVKAIIYYKARDYYSPIKQVSKTWKCIYGPRDNQKLNKSKKQKKEEQELKEANLYIEEPDVELNCIELTKISQMIIKNDPNVFEIFTSPLPYFIENKDIIQQFRKIIFATYDWFKLATHYIAWSNGNHKQLSNTNKKRIARKPLKMLRKFIYCFLRKLLRNKYLIFQLMI